MTRTDDHAALAGEALAEHRDYLLRFARGRLHDAALVEDVVQDTLLAALQGLDRYGAQATLRTWLTGILLHKIADAVRRERRSPLAASPDDAPGELRAADDESVHEDAIEWRDPARLLEARQIAHRIEHGLAQLPARAARAFVLREIDGLSTQEAAQALGVSPTQGSLLLHRARTRLREHLQAALTSMTPAMPATAAQ